MIQLSTFMKIGKLAELTGITRDTIRLYERMGLLKNVTRPFDFNNYKDYGEENVGRINLILQMKKIGFSLRECKEVLDKIEDGVFDVEFQNSFLKKKLKEIDEKIEELLSLKAILSTYMEADCSNEEFENIKKPAHGVEEEHHSR